MWVTFATADQDQNILNCTSDNGFSWGQNVPLQIGFSGNDESTRCSTSLAIFNNNLYLAYTGTDHRVHVARTGTGQDWQWTSIQQTSKSGTSLAVFNNQLWVGFIADNDTNDILLCSSTDGFNWSDSLYINQQGSFATQSAALSLAAFNNQLWVAFNPNNNTPTILLCSSTDGQNWPNQTVIHANAYSPSLAVFNNRLWNALIDLDVRSGFGNYGVVVASSSDGVNWTGAIPTNQYTGFVGQGVSLAVFNGNLWIAYIGIDQSNPVLVSSSSDGIGWTNSTSVNQFSSITPSLTAVGIF